MHLYLQKISLHWLKKHRAAPFSSQRSKIPTCFALPNLDFHKEKGLFFHSLTLEQNDQQVEMKNNNLEVLDLQSEIKMEGLHILFQNEANPQAMSSELLNLEVFFEYDEKMGAPTRLDYKGNFLKEKAFDLKQNEFGQIVYNGRIALEDTWGYRLSYWNIFYTQNLDKNIFLNHVSVKQYKQLASLR